MPPVPNNKQLELTVYKLLYDALALILLFRGLLLLADSLIPGFISGYVGYARFLSAVAAIIFLIIWLGKRNRIVFSSAGPQQKILNKKIKALLVLGLILIINSIFRFSWWEIAIAAAATAAVFFYLYRVLLDEK